MRPNRPTRRDVLRTAAASGLLLGTGVGATGTAAAQASDLPNHLLIIGRGEEMEYSFTVQGSVEKTTDPGDTGVEQVSINDNDVITTGPVQTSVQGSTIEWGDAYRFSGYFLGFNSFSRTSDLGVDVYLNGESVDPDTLGFDGRYHSNYALVIGNGERVNYEFTATGSVQRTLLNFARDVNPERISFNANDTIESLPDFSTRVSGVTRSWADAYSFSGEITSFTTDGPVTLYQNPEVPNVRVEATGCNELSLTNESDALPVLLDLVSGVDPTGEYPSYGDGFLTRVRPEETVTLGAPAADIDVIAGALPYWEYDQEQYGAGPLRATLNGEPGTRTVTVSSC